jgi:hypothetical protein
MEHPDEIGGMFLDKLVPLVRKALGNRTRRIDSIRQFTKTMVRDVRDAIVAGASSIYDTSYVTESPTADKTSLGGEVRIASFRTNVLMPQMMRYMDFGKLLAHGVTVEDIYLFLTRSFRGLLFMKFSLRDVKRLEETDQLGTLVRLYKIECDDLRAVLGNQLSIQNLLSFGWSAKTFALLGINMHQLCVMRLQKDQIPFFGFTMDEWMDEMWMTKADLKLLRIHATDFRNPGGKLYEAGWTLQGLIHHLDLSVDEVIKFQLNGYSSCFGTKAEDVGGFHTVTGKRGKTAVVVPKDEPTAEERSPSPSEREADPGDGTQQWRRRPQQSYGFGKKKVHHYHPRHSPSSHRARYNGKKTRGYHKGK